LGLGLILGHHLGTLGGFLILIIILILPFIFFTLALSLPG